jgi:hypothetical protein
MIYDINKKKIMIFNFTNLSFNEPNTEDTAFGMEDQELLNEYLVKIIILSLKNKEINNLLLEYNIIDEDNNLNFFNDDLYNELYEIFM